MSSMKQKFRLAGAFAALLTLGLAISCTGFFQNPTLTSLSIAPSTWTLETGTTDNTVQMNATGINNDNSITSHPAVTWTISGTDTNGGPVATISNSGLVTSSNIGTATVTATSNQNSTITATATVTVTVGCVTKITLNPTSGAVTTNVPTFGPITAEADTCNGSFDVTSVATWNSSNTALATVSAGTVTFTSGNTTAGTVNITASIGTVTSNVAVITVTP